MRAGLFTPEELQLFARCEEVLWRVRCHLHFVTGRAEERFLAITVSAGHAARRSGSVSTATVRSMATQETSPAGRVSELRQRYVSGAVATPPIVAARAEGAKVTDADGTTFIDFAGGLGCLNFGHNAPAVVAAIRDAIGKDLTRVPVRPTDIIF